MAVKHKAQRAAAGAVLDQLLKYVDKDPHCLLYTSDAADD